MHIRECKGRASERSARVTPNLCNSDCTNARGRSLSTEVSQQNDNKTMPYNFILCTYVYDKHGSCWEKHPRVAGSRWPDMPCELSVSSASADFVTVSSWVGLSVQQSGFVRKAALFILHDKKETLIAKHDIGFSSGFTWVRLLSHFPVQRAVSKFKCNVMLNIWRCC